jgi:nucleoid-associated protein YejK
MAIPELEQEGASRALRRYCEKVPPEIRDKLTKDFRFVRSDIDLFERRQHYLEPDRHVEHAVAKFRYNAKRGSWTLFWSDRNLRWHAYEGLEDRRDFLELLREVATDPTCIFWG